MSSPILDYGPPLPWRKRRSVRRAAILIALAICVLSAPWWGAPIYRHAKVLYWQRQCMNYKMPAGGTPAGTVPKEWSEFYQAIENRSASWSSNSVFFIGVVHRVDGEPRLVIVEDTSIAGFSYILVRVIRPGSLWRAPIMTTTNGLISRRPSSITQESQRIEMHFEGWDPKKLELWIKTDDTPLSRPVP